MSGIIIDTERLVSASDARKRFGQLLKDITEHQNNYYVILANGKISALLVHPNLLKEKGLQDFPSLEELRKEWNRYQTDIADAFEKLRKIPKKDWPPLLR